MASARRDEGLSERPSAMATKLRWNVPKRAGRSLWRKLYGQVITADPYEYAGSVPRAPSYEGGEVESVKEDLVECVARHARSRHDEHRNRDFSCRDVAFSGEVMGLFAPFDRTLETPADPALFSDALVEEIQRQVLAAWPLWRVHVVGDDSDGSTSLMIYADAVVFRDLASPPLAAAATASAWRQSLLEKRDLTLGAWERQSRFVEKRLPELVPRLQPHTVEGVAVFDNWQGRPCTNVWLLLDGRLKDFEFHGPVERAVTPVLRFEAGSAPYFRSGLAELIQFTFGQLDSNLEMRFVHTGTGTETLIAVKVGDVVTDHQLKDLET